MPLLLLKDLPRYECLLEGSKEFPELDPSACEAYLNLLRTGDEVFSIMEHYLSAHDISQGRFCVLMLLWKAQHLRAGADCLGAGDPCTPASLADAAGVTRATMTGLIDTLERDGLVRRVPNPDDRRMMTVQLVPEGQAFVSNLLPEYFKLIAAVMQGLDVAERKTLVGLLHKILERTAAMRIRVTPAPALR
ncbi:MAG: MarR family winged helix-turn-helix transcriptional regulator [Opitutales bacterium]